MREEVLRRLGQLRRRYRRVRAADAFMELAFVLTAGVAAMLLIDRLSFELGLARAHVTSGVPIAIAFAAALVVAAAVALASAAARRVTAAAIAWRADRALSMDERFLTSVELAADPVRGAGGPASNGADGASSKFAPALFAQAAEAMRSVDVRKVFPPAPVGYRWGVILAVAAGAVLAAFAPKVEPAPVADFSFAPERGAAPLEVAFEDASQGRIARWDWDFGDGRIAQGRSATHRYERPGRYVAKLVVRGPDGHSEKSAAIEVIDPSLPVAEFDAEPQRGRAPLDVRFTNRSHRADRSFWSFGDGEPTTERSPVHTFAKPGAYDVSLEVENALGSSRRVKRVRVIGPDAPMADFRAMPRKGPAPLVVDFEDNSTGKITEWEWDTGDVLAGKDRIRRERMPSHVYRLPGRYTVKLKVKGPGGEDELERVRYIEVESDGQDGGGGAKSGRGGGKGGGGAGNVPGAGGAGTQPGPVFGEEATRPKAEFTPETVHAQPQPGDLVEKVKNVYGKGGSGEGGADRPYDSQTFGEYQRAAEDAMNREHVPPSLRAYVKKYFEEIRPK